MAVEVGGVIAARVIVDRLPVSPRLAVILPGVRAVPTEDAALYEEHSLRNQVDFLGGVVQRLGGSIRVPDVNSAAAVVDPVREPRIGLCALIDVTRAGIVLLV